jgi:hypothetical protein
LRDELNSPLTKERFRNNEKAFSRNRILTFARLALLVIRGHKLALQNALNKAFTALGEVLSVPTGSAYCQARQKLKPELFAHLNEMVCRDFYQLYEQEGLVHRWHTHRVLACDGTYLNLPDTAETRSEFSLQVNQYEEGACVQALAVVLYDLKNELALAAALGKRQGEKNLLFSNLWQGLQADDLIVLDRHYADYTVITYALASNCHILVRMPKTGFALVQQFWRSGLAEQVLTLNCPVSAQEFVEKHNLAKQVRVRLIRVKLDNGETEVLLTTLLDTVKYPRSEFKLVYAMRWGEETFFARVKNILEVERFSGTSVIAIKQDFYGMLFLASLESVLSKSDEEALAKESKQRKTQTKARVNHSVSYVALLERVVQLLSGKGSAEEVLKELHHLFRTSPTRARPGRQVERRRGLRYAYKLRFHKYVKKIVA